MWREGSHQVHLVNMIQLRSSSSKLLLVVKLSQMQQCIMCSLSGGYPTRMCTFKFAGDNCMLHTSIKIQNCLITVINIFWFAVKVIGVEYGFK